MKTRRVLPALILLVLAAYYVLAYVPGANPLRALATRWPFSQTRGISNLPQASGVIAGREVALGTERAGRVERVLVHDGEAVAAGQELIILDATFAQRGAESARAALGVAQAVLENPRAGARPGRVALAEAELGQSRAALAAARAALDDLIQLRQHPQDLDLQIAVAQAQVKAAEQREAQAVYAKDAAEVGKGYYEYAEDQLAEWRLPFPKPGIPMSLQLAPYDWWKAWTTVNAAEAGVEGQRAALELLREMRAAPQELEAKIAAARAAVTQTLAAVDVAQSQLDVIRAGLAAEQLVVLEAQVDEAQVRLDAALTELDKYVLRAPIAGRVAALAVHPGEWLAPSATAATLVDAVEVTVEVFVSERLLGQVQVGQPVSITVDAWPARAFPGRVARIAESAEYTPRNVATQEGRALTYYAVQVTAANPNGALKPGMPADTVFGGAPAALGSQPGERSAEGQTAGDAQPLRASGVVQADETRLSAECAGTVLAVSVDEGQMVTRGLMIAQLGNTSLVALRDQAQSAVETARRNVASAQRPPTAETVSALRAGVRLDDAQRGAAEARLASAQAMLADPQQLRARLLQAQTQSRTAAQSVEAARADLLRATYERDHADFGSPQRRALDAALRAREAGLAAAEADAETARVSVSHLQALLREPLALQAAVHAAQQELSVAEAGLRVASARLQDGLDGPRPSEIHVARAQLGLAEAQLALAQAQVERLVLRAPRDGVVADRTVEVGEVLTMGAPVITIAAIRDLRVTVYIAEPDLGRVRPGLEAQLSVDSFPGRVFLGHVTRIGDRAEFTPRNVATREGRRNTYFAVDIGVPNADLSLKPGMPVDVVVGS